MGAQLSVISGRYSRNSVSFWRVKLAVTEGVSLWGRAFPHPKRPIGGTARARAMGAEGLPAPPPTPPAHPRLCRWKTGLNMRRFAHSLHPCSNSDIYQLYCHSFEVKSSARPPGGWAKRCLLGGIFKIFASCFPGIKKLKRDLVARYPLGIFYELVSCASKRCPAFAT